MSLSRICPGCGQTIQIAIDDSRTEIECLWCGTRLALPTVAIQAAPARAKAPAKAPTSSDASLEVSPVPAETAVRASASSPVARSLDDDEEGPARPYQFQRETDRACRGCGRIL